MPFVYYGALYGPSLQGKGMRSRLKWELRGILPSPPKGHPLFRDAKLGYEEGVRAGGHLTRGP